jgi:hypothetical protein
MSDLALKGCRVCQGVSVTKEMFLWCDTRANVIKLFTAVIYHHSMVIPSFCVIKLCYSENNYGMAVNYHGILTLEKVGLKYHRNLPRYCFITLAPGDNVIKLFSFVTDDEAQ